MKLIALALLCLLPFMEVRAQEQQIGKIEILKGTAQVKRQELKKALEEGELLNELDLITTGEKSLLKISLVDKTNLIIGPNSQLLIKKFSKVKRQNIFNFIRGSFRAKIQEKVSGTQTIKFFSNEVSVGVRGTEFITNTYVVNSKGVSDVALLEGSLNTLVNSTEEFNLKASEVINTNSYKISKKIQKLDPSVLKSLLENELELLPNLFDSSGELKDLNKVSTSISLPTPALAVASTATKLIPPGSKEDRPKRIMIVDRKELKNEPWDIRDAMLRRKSLRKENKCFYWFYKSLPGGGELERFRRERDCDEYEYDL